jgi:hypothetical protein
MEKLILNENGYHIIQKIIIELIIFKWKTKIKK